MSAFDWVIVVLIALGAGLASVVLTNVRNKRRRAERVTRMAALLADESETFEGQILAARRRYHNDIDVPYADALDGQHITLEAMAANWPQCSVYDIEDVILAEPYQSEFNGTSENNEDAGETSDAAADNLEVVKPEGPLSETTGRLLWSTLQHWRENPTEIFALLPAGAQQHYSRTPEIHQSFLALLSANSSKMSHAIYALTVDPAAHLETKTTLDEVVWFLAARAIKKQEATQLGDTAYEQALCVLPDQKVAKIFDLSDGQLLDENFLSRLGHTEWHPANWREPTGELES